jgi:ABC-type sugar transport system ATPase subunit
MADIELVNIKKTFGAHNAVQNLNMRISDGELLVLLGPSGCGKSTTMNMIAGLTEPSDGRILFGGRDVTDHSPHQRNVAMVFQNSLLYPHLSARQNIYMSLKRSGLPRAEIDRRIEAAAATVDVTRLLDKLPSQLSGGERQRVATAKAIVRQPDCFLLDEPLSALDAALRLSLRSELVNLQKRLRATMVFVTHDQIEAMTMGDRIGVMRNGELQQIGTPLEIYNEPATLFVAGFVGAPPMNFFRGALVDEGGRRHFVSPAVRVPITGAFAEAAPRGAVVLGIRPHQMRLSDEAPGAVALTVYAIEQLGNETVVICDGPDASRVRLLAPPGFTAPIGSRVWGAIDGGAARLYDPETEWALPAASRIAA